MEPPGGPQGRTLRENDDLPPDYDTTPLNLPGKDLLLSTFVMEDRKNKNGEKKTCLFCSVLIPMKPCVMKQHIDETYGKGSRECKACKPKQEHVN